MPASKPRLRSLALLLPFVALGLVLTISAGPAHAEETGHAASGDGAAKTLAGHSYEGEAFNEGPRQAAYLMGGTGNVNFPVTTKSSEAQTFFNQGVGQLHGFWYFEAERSFRQAAMLDKECAMAYWGMAMANVKNESRAKKFMVEAVKRRGGASPREQKYIDAYDAWLKTGSKDNKKRTEEIVKAYQRIIYDHPEDIEAKAFLCYQIWDNASRGAPIQSHIAVNALLKEILAAEPMHPCHHYMIHLWDNERPQLALESAARCGQSAPAIAHMWHMPGHTYSKVKRYADAVWQQEASARVDHAHMMRDRVMPDQIHNFAHNNEWLIRNLIFLGRAGDALSLAKNMSELPRHPKYNTIKRGSASYGRERLLDVLGQFEMWEEAVALSETPYLAPVDDENKELRRLRLLAEAQLQAQDCPCAEAATAELRRRLEEKIAERDKKVAEAEQKAREKHQGEPANDEEAKKRDDEIAKAKEEAAKPFKGPIESHERALGEVEALAEIANEEYAQAHERLKKLASPSKPLLARAAMLAGQKEEAIKLAREQVKSGDRQTLPLAHLTQLLWQAGERDEAKKAFDDLRKISASIDLSVRPFTQLTPIAQELGYAEDWRVAQSPADDVGERPALDTLGPFRWSPSAAPSWSLVDAHGKEHSLADWQGRPVIVIFYLGFGCLHCTEQLQAFAPKHEKFAQAGVDLLAISTDDREALKASIDNYQDGKGLPYLLLSDSSLGTFREHRCYDDFEKQPLHGTFLIDGEGRIRWQDIGFEPFMDVDFLLEESKRLLAQEAP